MKAIQYIDWALFVKENELRRLLHARWSLLPNFPHRLLRAKK